MNFFTFTLLFIALTYFFILFSTY
ncbi:uncharacterized protein METZ01_LOCUS501979, partial [marine metagenome]